ARVERMLADVVRDVSAAIGTTPANVWANFSPMAAVREGDGASYHPVVTILANPRPKGLVDRGLEAAAKAVAAGLGVPLEKVWVNWATLPPGQVFADGKIT
ncbi:MAG TPA: hypothetical protein VNI01_12375, partial [Elusimicrobiota bacterium]|nr:hypothetical protein [Elusimicrobiota bacterium]